MWVTVGVHTNTLAFKVMDGRQTGSMCDVSLCHVSPPPPSAPSLVVADEPCHTVSPVQLSQAKSLTLASPSPEGTAWLAEGHRAERGLYWVTDVSNLARVLKTEEKRMVCSGSLQRGCTGATGMPWVKSNA